MIASRTRPVVRRISSAATRPAVERRHEPLGDDARAATPASIARTCRCWCGGKKSMMRLIVSAASAVCSVEMTRWPVSAADSAVLHRLLVAHLADQDDVGVLAQDAAQRAARTSSVSDADLALVDHRALVAVQELDRVLDRDDVARRGRVDVVDHRGQRRRLARAGGAGDEHDAARLLGQLADDASGSAELRRAW